MSDTNSPDEKQAPSDDTESRIARIVEVGRGSRSSRAIAATIIAALAVAGYKIVAREPTEAMVKGAPDLRDVDFYPTDVFQGMWDAAG